MKLKQIPNLILARAPICRRIHHTSAVPNWLSNDRTYTFILSGSIPLKKVHLRKTVVETVCNKQKAF